MKHARRFPYAEVGGPGLPYLPLALTHGDQTLAVSGLLDTGASVNVLPYELGLKLGVIWEEQNTPVTLTGNLAHLEARVLLVSATVAPFPPIRLAFAWTRAEHVPLILGQVNFFMEFDVCFFRSGSILEIRPKTITT